MYSTYQLYLIAGHAKEARVVLGDCEGDMETV